MVRKSKLSKKMGRKLLCVLLCLMMSLSLLTVALADEGEEAPTVAQAPEGLQTVQPVLVVTGQGLPDGARGSAEAVSYEKAYTLDELRALEDITVERVYSSINSSPVKMFFRAQGIDLEGLLELSGYTDGGRIRTIAIDDYASVCNIDDERSFYPGLADDDDADAEIVLPMLAWKNIDNRDEPPVVPDPFETMAEEADGQSLRLFVGQLSVEDVNSNLYNRNVVKVVAGDEIEDVDLTVLGTEYTRADVMLMPRAEHTHTSGTTVRGVPLAELLKDVNDDVMICFDTVDTYDKIADYTMSKGELVARNALLAYEVETDDGWTGYYRSTDEGEGYFRLWIDDISGAHATCEVALFFGAEDAPAYNQDQIYAAMMEGLVPDSIAQAGWQNDTSRLATADAMVLLIEKASGKTMEELAEEFEWDLSVGGFDDTDSAAVTFLKYAEVANGYGDGTYRPDRTLSRAEAVTMLGRIAEKFFDVEISGDNPFTDVKDWAAAYVGYAAENEIALGVGNGLFNPDGQLQNQQTALFLIRTFNVWK
ncbi:MAG: S-layer homology domain-containing protein [Oscillospiraceae bacterium]|nr:S-layer homology domain-containing protein [Oscillospiraceae bacterium]